MKLKPPSQAICIYRMKELAGENKKQMLEENEPRPRQEL